MPLFQDIAKPLNVGPSDLTGPALTPDALFQGAGISEGERFKLLRGAFDLIRRHLKAKSKKVFHFQGALTYSKLLPDLSTRAKAADQVLAMLGVSNQEVPKVTVQVTVHLPPYMTSPEIPAPRDITPGSNESTTDISSKTDISRIRAEPIPNEEGSHDSPFPP